MLTKHNIRYVNENRTYIFSSDRVTFNGIQSWILSLLEELHSRRFGRENLGIPVHQYILKKRVVLCRASILGGGNITEIYLTFGFRDYSSLYRAFKKEYGMSPGEMREMGKEL